MKQTISETKIHKSNRSLASTIPHTIVSMETLTDADRIKWTYEIINNKITYTVEFIKDDKKTSSNIDIPTEKQTKNNKPTESATNNPPETTTPDTHTNNKPTITNSTPETKHKTTIRELHETTMKPDEQIEYYQRLKDNREHIKLSTDNFYQIAIHKNRTNKDGTQTFKLNFKTFKGKTEITNITAPDGSIEKAVLILHQLENMDKNEITEYILENSKNREQTMKILKEKDIIP